MEETDGDEVGSHDGRCREHFTPQGPQGTESFKRRALTWILKWNVGQGTALLRLALISTSAGVKLNKVNRRFAQVLH
jgi:hypothetical protein